jgi:V/A-type H+/Na+-transporting ATPase subunit E
VSDLTALLEHEASAEIESILAAARERASELLDAARADAEAATAARERSVATAREALAVRAQSSARLEASALKLRAQHEAVEAVFAAAQERIEAIARDAKAYEPVLAGLLVEALNGLGDEAPTEIVVAARDVELATALAAKQGVTAPVVAGDVAHGVRVRTGRGSSVENSLLGRLETVRGELASQVTEVLFGETTAA